MFLSAFPRVAPCLVFPVPLCGGLNHSATPSPNVSLEFPSSCLQSYRCIENFRVCARMGGDKLQRSFLRVRAGYCIRPTYLRCKCTAKQLRAQLQEASPIHSSERVRSELILQVGTRRKKPGVLATFPFFIFLFPLHRLVVLPRCACPMDANWPSYRLFAPAVDRRCMRSSGHYHNRRRGCPPWLTTCGLLGHASLVHFPAARYFCSPLLCYRVSDEAVASICVNARVMLRFIGTRSMNAPGATDSRASIRGSAGTRA